MRIRNILRRPFFPRRLPPPITRVRLHQIIELSMRNTLLTCLETLAPDLDIGVKAHEMIEDLTEAIWKELK